MEVQNDTEDTMCILTEVSAKAQPLHKVRIVMGDLLQPLTIFAEIVLEHAKHILESRPSKPPEPEEGVPYRTCSPGHTC